MAPKREQDVSSSVNAAVSDSEGNLWTSILAEVQTKGNNKLPSNKNLLVLGDNDSGKTTLIAKLQGVEDPKKGYALEYAYIDVRDEYRDDNTRLSVWVLDGHPAHSQLLKFALPAENMPNTLVMFVASMTTPWDIFDQLQNWVMVLQDHIESLKLPSEKFQEYRQKIVHKWQEYAEHGDDLDMEVRRTSRNLEDEMDQLPLSEGVLTSNLGLDIVVVITKTDYMTTLEKEHDYRDAHFDYIQQWIRTFCLQYGAALFYTSAKEDKNCDLLYKYLTHRLYNLPFRTPALVVEKEALLIPSGWDNMKKISIVCENLQYMKPDDYYRDVIPPPSTRKGASREIEIVAEDEQVFLARMLTLLQQGHDRASPAVQKTGDRSRLQASPIQGPHTSPKKVDASKVTSTSGEGVLANFFNSLLHKKTGAVAGATGSPKAPGSLEAAVEKAFMRSDAAAELDRLTRTKSPGGSNSLDSSNC
ncbi:cytoplasmic dynein 1 light intermediate chain 2 isoform X2 [Cimex lectularius]|uniref:Dynein light intermediate chain n=1 Tax=Cimex lectularius TaxID=79782 RepID=A0A8I6RR61_CIMLE|nr:cytoplasmic dynein 1 light intermediate chain 2 isoform X2 [Cimex lectularius]